MSESQNIMGQAVSQASLAADPQNSAWVAANAGSGKTYILITRLVRLMLSGVVPEKLLCLTYTRSAAAEMQDRLFSLLAEWALLDDDALQEAIDERLGTLGAPHDLALARMLFARALETPGGLRVQTIHSFCESLLKRFPLEAGLSPQFDLLDEHEARAMQTQIIRGLLMRHDDPDLRAALDALTRQISERDLNGMARSILSQRDRFTATDAAQQLNALADRLDLSDMPEAARHPLQVAQSHIDAYQDKAAGLAQWLGQSSSVNDGKQAAHLARFHAHAKDGKIAEAWDSLDLVFFKREGGAKTSLVTKKYGAAEPAHLAVFNQWAAAFEDAFRQSRACHSYQLTKAVHLFARHLLDQYALLKEQRGLLDYDDLIERTNDMLARKQAAAWVLFKIDSGLEHILVDEAQDTSPAQWRVIRALANEFFAGETAQQTTRTIFAVGDEKQSIFSFQGADPAGFDAQFRHFSQMIEQIGGQVNYVPLKMSWRSAPEILQLVDKVFESSAAARGLSASGEKTEHLAQRQKATGYVALWQAETPPESSDVVPANQVPSDGLQETARQKLARRIADKIDQWMGDPSSDIRAGDILILVRKRDDFVEDMIRALKRRQINVAGADRMVLLEQIAIMDLMAAADFALHPEDDLSLACVLRSPLGGLSDDQLFDLAHGRSGSLWAALGAAQADDPALGPVHQRLTWLLDNIDYLRPYNYFAELLSGQNGHALLRARLGFEIDDAIGEFLRLALAFESQNIASMQGFLNFVRQGEQVIKRDMENRQDAVRIMTVHGAKGLEAPIVFLPDTCGSPTSSTQQRGSLHMSGAAEIMWRANKKMREPYSQSREEQAHEAEIAESKRLLYVALTRARDRLYIGGYLNRRPPNPAKGSWYEMLAEVMQKDAFKAEVDGETLWHFGDEAAALPERDKEAPAYEAPPAPDWVSEKISATQARQHIQAEKIFAPSLLGEARGGHDADGLPADDITANAASAAGDSQKMQAAALRGTLSHALFEHLPALPKTDQRAAAETYLARHAADLLETNRQQMIDDVLAVLSDPSMADLFAPQSRAEAPIAGHIKLDNGERLQFSGQIDRYVETPDGLYLVDFKTGRVPETVPLAYLRQMAVYRALMQAVHPDKPVHCGLVWTQACRTDWLASDDLDAALASLTSI